MKKIIIFIALASILRLNTSCSNDYGLTFPLVVAELTYPSDNLLCIDNIITFNWRNSDDTLNENLNYTLLIAKDRGFTDIVESSIITTTEITLTLEKSVAYYWKVITTNIQTSQTVSSEISSFFTKGEGIVNYAPFNAELVSPAENSSISSGIIDLSWRGSDVDADDVLSYELYFGESSSPILLEDALPTVTFQVPVDSGKTYYWKINVVDQHGAKSIGQIWSFTVN